MLYDVEKAETSKKKRKGKHGDFLEVADVDQSIGHNSAGSSARGSDRGSNQGSLHSQQDLQDGRGSTVKLNAHSLDDEDKELTPKTRSKASTPAI